MGLFSKLLTVLLLISASANGYLYLQNQKTSMQPWTIVVGEMIVMRTNGGVLEVSTVTGHEQFNQASSTTIFGFTIPTSEVIATVQAKATYRYHVKLAPEWKFFRRGNVFTVIAPPIQPSLPVAIDTTTLQVFSSGLWSPVTGNVAITGLLQKLTPVLENRSWAPSNIQLQRDSARLTVAEFVRKWVMGQDKWKEIGDKAQVQVFFADEPAEKLQAAGYGLAPYKL